MSTLIQTKRDALNAWFDKFVIGIRYDLKDKEEAISMAKVLLDSERLRGPIMVKEEDLQPGDHLIKTGLILSRNLKLPVTAAGLAMLLLGCNQPTEVLMNVVFAKKQFELVKGMCGPLADAEFMTMFFGQGTIEASFYREMWKLQQVPGHAGPENFLRTVQEEDFKEFSELRV